MGSPPSHKTLASTPLSFLFLLQQIFHFVLFYPTEETSSVSLEANREYITLFPFSYICFEICMK